MAAGIPFKENRWMAVYRMMAFPLFAFPLPPGLIFLSCKMHNGHMIQDQTQEGQLPDQQRELAMPL